MTTIRAHTVRLETDEDGFSIVFESDDQDDPVTVNVQDVWYDVVKAAREIQAWWDEGRAAAREHEAFRASLKEVGAYALDDPKHPTYHDRMSAVWDNRDKSAA